MRPYETPLHDPWCVASPFHHRPSINSTVPVVALLHRISSLCLALTTIPHIVSNRLGCFLCSCALPACACVRMSALLYVIPAVYPASVIAMLSGLCPANSTVTISPVISSLPEANRNHTCSDDTALLSCLPASISLCRLHPPSQGNSPPFLTDCSEICRTRRAAATAQRRCRFSASVVSPSQKIPQNAARREETAANPPVLCSPSCKLQARLSFTPTGRQLTSPAPPP